MDRPRIVYSIKCKNIKFMAWCYQNAEFKNVSCIKQKPYICMSVLWNIYQQRKKNRFLKYFTYRIWEKKCTTGKDELLFNPLMKKKDWKTNLTHTDLKCMEVQSLMPHQCLNPVVQSLLSKLGLNHKFPFPDKKFKDEGLIVKRIIT